MFLILLFYPSPWGPERPSKEGVGDLEPHVDPRPGSTPLKVGWGGKKSRCWLHQCASVEGGVGKEGLRERSTGEMRPDLPASTSSAGRPGHRGREPGWSLLCGMPLGRDREEEEEASVELRSHRSQGVTLCSVGPT